MTDGQIESQLKTLIQSERKTTNEILKLINLAETRDIPLKRGFPRTFEWLTTGLGYSRSAAQRRVQSARLLRAVPNAERKLETGAVNLTTLAKAQSTMRAAERVTKTKLTDERKAEVVDAISNQSSDEADATLLELFPKAASTVHQERTKRINAEHTRLTFNFGKDEMENLAWTTDFLSHAVPDGSHAKIFARLLDDHRRRNEGKRSSKSRRMTCEYRDPNTNRVCGETFQIEDDHVVPRAVGGSDELRNMRCLCRRHNAMMAREWLGPEWAGAWRRRREAEVK